MTYQLTQIKRILNLKEKKNLKIEKDLKTFHLKNLKRINSKEQNLSYYIKPILNFISFIFKI